jgi:hypothetical protein
MVGYHDIPAVSEKLVLWAKSMKEEFEVALDRIRLVELQQSTNLPSFHIQSDDSDYSLALDA